jgi:hypothetical protein
MSVHMYIHTYIAGLPDFSWYMIPKPEKCTKTGKMYQMVIKYPKCPYIKYSKWP